MTEHNEIMARAGYVPAQAAATAIGRSLTTMHRWARDGTVSSARSAKQLFVEVASLRRLFAGNAPVLRRLEALGGPAPR